MNQRIVLQPLTMSHIDIVVLMAAENYRMEQKNVGELTDRDTKFFYEKLHKLIMNGTGLIAYEAEEPVGFLAFDTYEAESEGIYGAASPLYGYGIRHARRGTIIGMLFQALAAKMCENYVQNFSVSAYTHDTDVLREYIMLSFAMEDTDAVRSTEYPVNAYTPAEYVYREVPKSELYQHREVIIELYRSLINHLRNSPVFYHCSYFLPIEDRFENFLSDGIRVFAIFDGDRLIGMINAEKADRILSESDRDALGMGDVFILPEYRGQDLAASLLNYANDRLREGGTKRLYVVHGTINPTARGFWDRHFTNYAYTMNRSIDSEMLGKIRQF